jgi:hypothetical protein
MIKLKRQEMPQKGIAFVVMPYGTKSAEGAAPVDFDGLYERIYAETITRCGMRAIRADGIWGCDRGILDVVWRGIQTAEVVIVDCSTRSIDVGLELGLSMALGKRLIVTAQRIEDVPTDLRGHLRPVLYKPEGFGYTDLAKGLEKELESVRNEIVIENTFVSVKTITGEPKPGRWLRSAHAHLSPELAFQLGFCLVQGAGVGAGGQVLPAPVGDQDHDVGTLARGDRLVR